MYSLSITKIYLYFKIFSFSFTLIYLSMSLSLSHLSSLSFKKGSIVVQKYLLESARYKTGIRQMKKKSEKKKLCKQNMKNAPIVLYQPLNNRS